MYQRVRTIGSSDDAQTPTSGHHARNLWHRTQAKRTSRHLGDLCIPCCTPHWIKCLHVGDWSGVIYFFDLLLAGLGLQIIRTAIVPTGYLEQVNRKGG